MFALGKNVPRIAAAAIAAKSQILKRTERNGRRYRTGRRSPAVRRTARQVKKRQSKRWRRTRRTSVAVGGLLGGANEVLPAAQDIAVPPAFLDLVPHDFKRFIDGKRLLVAALGPEGVVDVDNGDDANQRRQRVPAQAIGIARPVEFLVMMTDERERVFDRTKLSADLAAENRVALHDRELFLRVAPR